MQIAQIPHELDFPYVEKPYLESVDGSLVAKMSPQRSEMFRPPEVASVASYADLKLELGSLFDRI